MWTSTILAEPGVSEHDLAGSPPDSRREDLGLITLGFNSPQLAEI